MEYEGGVTASYFVSDGTPGPWNYDLAAEENTFFTMCPGENSMRVFGTKGSFGFPNMDLYYQDDDAYGWLRPVKHEHFEVEKNDPMTAELEHFVDLCLGRETVPRCTGENAPGHPEGDQGDTGIRRNGAACEIVEKRQLT